MLVVVVDVGRVRTAHGDAWEAEGVARVAAGGGATRVRGARLMASGLPFAQWNNADATVPDVDEPAMRAWYARRGVPWGIRVPLGLTVDLGTPLFVKRCFWLEAAGFRNGGDPPGDLLVRRLAAGDVEPFAEAEAGVFGGDVAGARRWLAPVFGRPGFEHWIAERRGRTTAIASAVWSAGDAGPAVMLTGIGTTDPGDDSSIAPLLTGLLEAAFDRDPDVLAHSHAAPADDPSPLTAVGFAEVPGFLVRLVVPE